METGALDSIALQHNQEIAARSNNALDRILRRSMASIVLSVVADESRLPVCGGVHDVDSSDAGSTSQTSGNRAGAPAENQLAERQSLLTEKVDDRVDLG